MSRPLALYRVVTLIGMTLCASGGLVLARLLAFGSPERSARITDRFVTGWARATRRLIGMRVRVDGELPSGPVAIVANHLSYVDIVALWSVTPGVFVARADVAGWPLIGQAGRLIGTIFIDRTRKRDLLRVIPEMERPLAAGRTVIFFPEGTSSKGCEILPFKSSLFEPAVRRGVPVVTASLRFETAPPAASADQSVCWWGGMTFAPHVFELLHIPTFDARIRFSSPIQPEEDRKALCRAAAESIRKSFLPTTVEGVEDDERRVDAGAPARWAALDCGALLEDGRALIEALGDEHYAFAPETMPGATPGAHTRHIIDYVDCLLSGLDAGVIDYTARKRRPEIEQSREIGLQEIGRCIADLERIARLDEATPLRVRADEGEDWTVSSLGRELRFVASHAVHHYALIRLTLARIGIETPASYGVSPSTLAHRRRQSAG